MKDWPTPDIKLMLKNLPRIPISESQRQDSEPKIDALDSEDQSELEIDWHHPSAFWGYQDEVKKSGITFVSSLNFQMKWNRVKPEWRWKFILLLDLTIPPLCEMMSQMVL